MKNKINEFALYYDNLMKRSFSYLHVFFMVCSSEITGGHYWPFPMHVL